MTEHRHRLTFHRHPTWHGHCEPMRIARNGEGWGPVHSCRRWHFHLPFTHKHTETGR